MNQDLKSQSQWLTVTDLMNAEKVITLGQTHADWYHTKPRKILDYLSYYKFASKIIGKSKRVLDVGCSEGFGTYLMGKECGWAKGIDLNPEAISVAKSNFYEKTVEFSLADVLKLDANVKFDAIVNFNAIEHLSTAENHLFWNSHLQLIKSEGLVIIGTPNPITLGRNDTSNDYTFDHLETEMSRYFDYVFPFVANDEVVHTGNPFLAEFYIFVGCKKK